MATFYDAAMRRAERICLGAWRRELLAPLAGRVIELGSGTGVNLDYCPPAVTELVLTEPDRHMRARLQKKLADRSLPYRLTAAAAEELPFADLSFDAAVVTLVFCSVRHPEKSLAELHRVLKPGGRLFLIEHVSAAGDTRLSRWQQRIEPVWKKVAGNCHLTRDTRSLLESAGFDCRNLRDDLMRGAPSIAAPVIRGIAVKTEHLADCSDSM